jgi:hypothetical protein
MGLPSCLSDMSSSIPVGSATLTWRFSGAPRSAANGLITSAYTGSAPEREYPRAAAAYHPQQLIPQFGGGLDVDLPADLDYQRGTGPDGYAQVRRLGAVRDSRSRLPPGIEAAHDPQ